MKYLKIQGVGVNIPQLTVSIVKNIKIPLPSLEIQKQIVEEFEILENEIKEKEMRLQELLKAYDKILEKYL
ncbi:restriction endonuclease subunit S [Campylobacter sp. RM12327]|nr:restriction endonuclease subunit S [Campylobacter sp. RM11302]MBF6668632.1 restriction endonuclease subunit S [Campylobacter sp. RM12327]MBF6674112.1 restriction endonuclease subunit S [Campylobacter sp. RM13538]MBF6675581.1 restriction endonuclease subunit S [Campylobacter sp. RM12321]MBF6677411.1 restriction endonuclease subunit S [Campylobacter sp. RM11259]